MATVISKWTADDEAVLKEMLARKQRIYEEQRLPLVKLMGEAPEGDMTAEVVDYLIARADDFVRALQPFVK